MKKIIFLILYLLIPIMVFAYPTGDVNGDNKVSSMDYVLIRGYLLKNIDLTIDEKNRADVNIDGKISSLDYIKIRKLLINGVPISTSVPTPSSPPISTPIPTSVPVNEYKIIYHGNGATTGSVESHICKLNEICTIKPNGFINGNKTFVGWTTKSNGVDDNYGWTNWSGVWNYKNGEHGIVNYELNLYARWNDYRVTQDINVLNRLSNYALRASATTSTLEYKTYNKKNNNSYNYTLIWVKDAYLQVKSGLSSSGYGHTSQGYAMLDYNAPGKTAVGVNASFFWNSKPEARIYRSNGVNYVNENLNRQAYTIIGITKEGIMKDYGTSSQNIATLNQLLDNDGVRNTVAGNYVSSVGYNASKESDENLTLVCQIDANNFALFSGKAGRTTTLAEMWYYFGCRIGANLDGGGSARLYHKNSNSGATSIWVNNSDRNRNIADILYFVEQ